MTTQAEPQTQDPPANYCPRDRTVETNLRCGKCGAFICPRCLIQTPVGARCPDCARMKKNPVFDPSTQETVLAVVSGVAVAVVCGVVLAALSAAVFKLGGHTIYLAFVLIAPAGTGWLAGETVYRTAKFKRSKSLMWVAAVAGFVVYATALVVTPLFNLQGAWQGLWALIGLAIGIYAAIGRVRP